MKTTFDTCASLTSAIAFGGTFGSTYFGVKFAGLQPVIRLSSWADALERFEQVVGGVVVGFVVRTNDTMNFFSSMTDASDLYGADVVQAGGTAPDDLLIGRVVLTREIFEAGKGGTVEKANEADDLAFLLEANALRCGYGNPELTLGEKAARAYRLKLLSRIEQMKFEEQAA